MKINGICLTPLTLFMAYDKANDKYHETLREWMIYNAESKNTNQKTFDAYQRETNKYADLSNKFHYRLLVILKDMLSA